MSKYIRKLIEGGESQVLDFKFEISDSKKIARTIVAFANTDGGKLLIGVKDNGVISGIRTDEEYHMVQAATDLYCRPKLKFSEKVWHIEGKTIMEITIPKSEKLPHFAPDKNGKWMAWVRVNDMNILANDVLVEVWKRKKSKKGTYIRYTDKEQVLLDYLSNNLDITLSRFCKIARLNRFKAKKILVNLLTVGVLEININEKTTVYKLKSKSENSTLRN